MQKCRFCGSNVIVPSGVIRNSPQFGAAGALDFGDLSALTGKALKIAEIQQLIQNGQKIEAIKVFRETFGCGLAESKNAVEAMERGESIDVSGMRIQSATSSVNVSHNTEIIRKAAIGIGGSAVAIFLVIGLFITGVFVFAFFMISRTVDRATESEPKMPTPAKQVTQTPAKDEPETIAETLKFGGEGIGAGKFKDNRSIAVTADGLIFSADYQGGRVQAFDADGNFKQQITAETSRTVDKLAVDRRGTLYVKQGYDIFRFDAGTGQPQGSIRIDYASDLALGLDGKLYVPTRRGEIQVLNPDGLKARTLKPSADLNLNSMNHIVIDGSGNITVLDRNYALFKLSPEGKLINRFGGRGERSAGRAPKGLFSDLPRGLAVDSQGRLYVLEMERVSVFDPERGFIKDFKTNQAFAIALDDKDRVFVASRPFVVAYKPF
jgi:sugar lactone lactonase YvrE